MYTLTRTLTRTHAYPRAHTRANKQVVDVGSTEVKIEAIMNNFVQLNRIANPHDENVDVELSDSDGDEEVCVCVCVCVCVIACLES